MNKTLNIWGRDFDLEIYFDCYAGETVSDNQKEALELFLQKPQLISEAKDKVIDYCLKRDAAEIGGAIENIFKYVIPQSIYVQKSPDKAHVVGLMCAYRFNPEDGLAVVFRNEAYYEVGSQNIII